MQNKAHAFAAGIFVLLVTALGIAMAVWLTRDTDARDQFELFTQDGVTGLRAQAAVRYRGVPVGKVTSISLDPKVNGTVLVRISVSPSTPVTKATFATLGFQGVTGSSFVQLEDDGVLAEALVTSDEQPARIPLRPGLIGTLTERGTALLGQVEMTARRLNELMAPENQQKLFTAVEKIGSSAEGLQRQGATIQSTLAHTMTQRLDPALASVPQVSEETVRALKSLQATSAELGRTAAEFSRVGNRVAQTADDFSLLARRLTDKGGTLDRLAESGDRLAISGETVAGTAARMNRSNLPSALSATENTARAAQQLERSAARLTENPQQLIFGSGAAPPGPGEPGFVRPEVKK